MAPTGKGQLPGSRESKPSSFFQSSARKVAAGRVAKPRPKAATEAESIARALHDLSLRDYNSPHTTTHSRFRARKSKFRTRVIDSSNDSDSDSEKEKENENRPRPNEHAYIPDLQTLHFIALRKPEWLAYRIAEAQRLRLEAQKAEREAEKARLAHFMRLAAEYEVKARRAEEWAKEAERARRAAEMDALRQAEERRREEARRAAEERARLEQEAREQAARRVRAEEEMRRGQMEKEERDRRAAEKWRYGREVEALREQMRFNMGFLLEAFERWTGREEVVELMRGEARRQRGEVGRIMRVREVVGLEGEVGRGREEREREREKEKKEAEEERKRAAKERAERDRQNKKAEEQRKRTAKERAERARQKQAASEARKRASAEKARASRPNQPFSGGALWAKYEHVWSTSFTPSSMPWPVASRRAEDVCVSAVEGFYRRCVQDGKEGMVKVLKRERLRWHPDKMGQRMGRLEGEVGRRVTEVFQIVDALLARVMGREGRSEGLRA